MAYPLVRNYYFNVQFNLYGMMVLCVAAVLVCAFAYLMGMLGILIISVLPLLFGVFLLGLFTGRPCMTIKEDYFQYRGGPFGRLHHVELDDVEHVSFEGNRIKVYCHGQHKPAVSIKSSSFRKAELSSVNDYFIRVKQAIGANPHP